MGPIGLKGTLGEPDGGLKGLGDGLNGGGTVACGGRVGMVGGGP